MHMISPYSPQYNVPHIDLVKYGQPILNEGIRKASGPLSTPFEVGEPLFTGQLVSITSAHEPVNSITIFYRKKIKGGLAILTTSVDTDTGYFAESNEGFEFIAHFDPKTLPKKVKTHLSDVGYWTLNNHYVDPEVQT